MNIQLKTKGISQNVEELLALQSMLKSKQLAIPSSKKGVLTVEKLFTSEHKRVVLHCELDIEVDKKRHVCSSRSSSKLIEAAKSVFSGALDQLTYITQLSQAS